MTIDKEAAAMARTIADIAEGTVILAAVVGIVIAAAIWGDVIAEAVRGM